jgi:hypothetical protein
MVEEIAESSGMREGVLMEVEECGERWQGV